MKTLGQSFWRLGGGRRSQTYNNSPLLGRLHTTHRPGRLVAWAPGVRRRCWLPSARARVCATVSASSQAQAYLQVQQRSAEPQQLVSQDDASELLPISVRDGSVVVNNAMPVLRDLQPHHVVGQQRPDAVVLGFESAAGETAMIDLALGTLCCRRFLLCARNKLWWMTPEWGSSAAEVKPETQFLLVELGEGGPYAILLPLIADGTFRATLRPPPRKHGKVNPDMLHIRIESGNDDVKAQQWQKALYIAAGENPFELVEKAVAAAAALSGGAKPRRQKQMPPTLDVFGWCTWDAFYSRVSAKGLQEGLGSLVEAGFPPRFLIIDDGWQTTDVDKRFRQAPTTRMMPALDEGTPTSDEFIDAELEMLATAIKDIPPSSSAGVALAALREEGDLLEHHKGQPKARAKEKGRWLQETLKESMNSMSEELGDEPWSPLATFDLQKLRLKRLKKSFSSKDEDNDVYDDDGSDGGSTASMSTDPLTSSSGDALTSSSGDALTSSSAIKPTSTATGRGSEQRLRAATARRAVMLERALQLRKPSDSADQAAETSLVEAAAAEVVPAEQQQREEGTLAPIASPEVEVVQEPHRSKLAIIWDYTSRFIAACFQRLAGLLLGGLEMLLLKYYTLAVDTAPPDAWSIRAFNALATGPFKDMLLEFYAASGDFTRRLTSIKANSKFSSPDAGPEDFFSGKPEALGEVVAAVRDTFGVEYIYCWHGLPAYWSGISTEDEEMLKYDPQLRFAKGTPGLYEIEPSMQWNPSVVAGVGFVQDPSHVYTDMHHYLASSGITGVKVDCQAGIGMAGSIMTGGPALAATYHRALEHSVQQHFPGNHCINCMCHSTENIYSFSETAVARASDDFWPRDPASSAPHVGACAYNSVFLSALVQPDWDMFHSNHAAAELHATARALSGGSIYVSDAPGQHDVAVLARLVLPDGTILRAQLPGRPTRDCLFSDVLRDGTSLLKVWNVNGGGGGVVGVFHLQGSSWDRTRRQFVIHDKAPPRLRTTVRVADVESLRPAAVAALVAGSSQGNGAATAGPAWAAYHSGTTALHRMTAADELPVELESGKSATITITPIVEQDGVGFAALGLVNMINTGGAVLASELRITRSGNGVRGTAVQAEVQLKGSGTFVAYASRRPQQVQLGGAPAEWQWDEEQGRVSVDVPLVDRESLERSITVALSA